MAASTLATALARRRCRARPVADGSVSPAGALGGVQLGYNSRFGSFVFGAEGDIDYSWMKDTNTSAACTNCEVRNHYVATFRGRAGYAIGNWLPYVTGGGALGDIQISTASRWQPSDQQAGLDGWRRR